MEREAIPEFLIKFSIQMYLSGLSLSNTVRDIDVFGIKRARFTVHNWVHKADPPKLDGLNSGIAIVECLCVFFQQCDDEIVRVTREVVDELCNTVRVDCFDGVEEHKRNMVVHLVDEIASKREHETSYFSFTLTKMVDDILVYRPRVSAADHVQFELVFGDFASPLADLLLGTFDPNPFEVFVTEQIQQGIHVGVEFLDCVGLEILDFRPEGREFFGNFVSLLLEALAVVEFRFGVNNLGFNIIKVRCELLYLDFYSTRLLLKVEYLAFSDVFEFVNLRFEALDPRLFLCSLLFEVFHGCRTVVNFGFNSSEFLL